VDPEQARKAVDAFLAAATVEVERLMKSGMRTFDTRSAVLSILVQDSPSPGGHEAPSPTCAILQVVVRHATPAVRPDDVLTGPGPVGGREPPVAPRVTRLAQGPLLEAAPRAAADAEPAAGSGAWPVGDPMALDRSASAKSGP